MNKLMRNVVSAFVLAGVLAGSGGMVPTLAFAQDQEWAESASQDDFYCARRKLGTWFYCERPKPVEEQKREAAETVPAAVRLKAITDQLDEMKARAILDPTTENVTAYVMYQREQLDRASTFADVWQRSLWQNPEIDYTLQRPVSTLGKRAWLDGRSSDVRRSMAGLSQRYGMFYFYSSSCAACEIFSPILRSLSEQFNLQVLPVSMDGGPNKTFENYVVDTGQSIKMGLSGRQVPALVLFDTVTKQPIPIGYGVMSADEVMDRIFTLTNVAPGSDY